MRGTDAETPSGRRRYVKGRSAERLAFEGEELRRPSYRRPELWAAVQSAHRVSRPETKSLARMNSRPSSRLFKASSSATSDPGSFDAAQTVTQHRTPSPEGFDPGEQRAGRNHARTLRGPTNLFRQTLLTRCGRSGAISNCGERNLMTISSFSSRRDQREGRLSAARDGLLTHSTPSTEEKHGDRTSFITALFFRQTLLVLVAQFAKYPSIRSNLSSLVRPKPKKQF